MRWRDGAWRLQVYVGRGVNGRDRRITRTVRAALTLSTYAAWMPEADRRAADRMGALLEQRSAVDE